MTEKELIEQLLNTGERMRIAQRAYFKYKTASALSQTKKYEKDFDIILEKIGELRCKELFQG